MFKSVEVTLFVILTLFVLLMIAAFGVALAVKNEAAFLEKCETKGGEALYTKSGMICFNKEALIKE